MDPTEYITQNTAHYYRHGRGREWCRQFSAVAVYLETPSTSIGEAAMAAIAPEPFHPSKKILHQRVECSYSDDDDADTTIPNDDDDDDDLA